LGICYCSYILNTCYVTCAQADIPILFSFFLQFFSCKMWQRKTKSNNVNVPQRVVNNSKVRSLGTWSPIQRMTRNVHEHLRVCIIDFVILFVILLFWWTASIKLRLLFSRAGYASWGLSLLISLLWTLWTLFRKYFIFCLVTLNPLLI